MPTIGFLLTGYEQCKRHEVLWHSRLNSAAKHLHRLLGTVEAADITDEVIEEYRNKRRAEGVKFSTIRRELGGVLRPTLQWGKDRNHLTFVPHIPLPPRGQGRPDWMKPYEVWQLLRSIEEGTVLYLFVMIALYTGARLSAIVTLKWEQIDFYLNQIDFRVADDSGRMKQRAIVPMCRTLRKIMLAAREEATDEYVFRVSVRTMQRYFREAVALAKLPEVITVHVVRHTAITLMLADGSVALLVASRFAGHKKTATTEETYLHATVRELVPGVKALERQIGYFEFKKNKNRVAPVAPRGGWKTAA